ncbi:MAG: hypothetical protein PHU78_04250 [Heliobacteriaceae bacterium]|nr:hypothetical protein [Heliobacteriaceae bacterium]
MKHYTEAEWKAFKNGETDAQEMATMEDHLLRCQDCITRFLSLIEEVEVTRAGRFVPGDFSHRTMQSVQKSKVRKRSSASWARKKHRFFTYYVAASIVTLFLVSQGVFQAVAQETVKLPKAGFTIRTEAGESLLFNWPQVMTEKSNALIDRVFVKQRDQDKEVGK